MEPKEPVTVLLGASPDPRRYAYLALQTLVSQGRLFVLVNPKYPEIDGHPVLGSLAEVRGPVDTVSVYLSPERQGTLETELGSLGPRRVIFNPGAENPSLEAALTSQGIRCLEACTLVLLKTGQF